MPVTVDDLLSCILEGYVEVDRDLRILHMNPNAESLLRRDRAGAVGQALVEVIPDASRSQHWPALVEIIQSGRQDTISIFYPAQYRWHDVTVIPVSGGGAGLLMRDVTDRQWLIRREAERVYLKNVFEDVPVAITLLRGKNLAVEYMNAFARQLIGDRNIIGLDLRDALPDLEQRELFDIVENVYTSGVPYHARGVRVDFDRDNDGEQEEGCFDISYHAVRDFDSTVSGVLSISIEVTDRRPVD